MHSPGTNTGAVDGRHGIMVVDDDAQVLQFITWMVAALGFDQIYKAGSAHQALEIWSSHRQDIDLVISDFVMPDVTGDRLALQLVSDNPQIRFLFISGNDPRSIHSAIPLIQGKNFLQKPFTLAQMKTWVDGKLPPMLEMIIPPEDE